MLEVINIVVDLDNTLLDAISPHLKYYNLASGRNIKEEDVNDFNISRLYNWDREQRESIYSQYGTNIHWESIPYPMAVNILNTLSSRHNITIMTARPLKFEQVTINWLEHHKVNYHNIVFTDNKYKEFMVLQADVLVDDAPHYAIEFSNNNIPVILFHQIYNSQIDNSFVYRANNWMEVKEYIDTLEELIIKKELTLE